MKNEILSHMKDPGDLEKLYQKNKVQFKREFNGIYPELKGNHAADFWYERLNFRKDIPKKRSNTELLFVVLAALLAGVTAKLPAIFSIDDEFFYSRNVGFIIFPVLMVYFAWKNKISSLKSGFIALSTLVGLIYINALPAVPESDTLFLACTHLLLFLWILFGFTYVQEWNNNTGKRLQFLKYNGDLVVLAALICIAGGLMTAITIGLFSLIGFSIEEWYFQNIVVFGLAAVPVVGTYLTQTNPQLVGKVSPVIARIFSPLVLVMLVIYLVAMLFSGNDPYRDREFLIIFNALLIGVMALVFFSIAGTSAESKRSSEIWILFLLSIMTIIVNSIGLSAILFRISEWGMTPNRAAVLGANGLILLNLLLVTAQLFRVITKKTDMEAVGKAIALYLPVYFLWAIVVTFIFPLIFGIN
ncbi:DUF4153 domain-containing protein [Salinimicrobium marinum]|uniref:DUF4153 domain-containing protein n=1 Tax=Salinimicrobium marinum TaxID=680283 RepID=A0A918SD72_9FLAO|nr:hypothetical protein [Salinimicrobium marinum]GHA34407.1 DUF4153 domain-containing protein [Salinimicrobium marinum]